jgi:hypothetical protein
MGAEEHGGFLVVRRAICNLLISSPAADPYQQTPGIVKRMAIAATDW